ncbi:MAG: bifunctional aldolase/short-chain dehydrogenase [Hyphomicrobiales bacterium]
MRDNKWNDADAENWVAQKTADMESVNEADRELALRVYSSRLIGSDPDLVMHGGGNTSVKVVRPDLFGRSQNILHVKGSGWDLDSLQAEGMPGVRMDTLIDLRALDGLSDEEMVNVQRANLLDSSAPNPSVETLLHAYLPHKVVDHTHATAFLALANLPDAETAVREIFGARLTSVPYIMPGFALAKHAAEAFDQNSDVEGLVLLKHGHFTFADTAKASYEKVISHTNEAEDYLAHKASGRRFTGTVFQDRQPLDKATAADVLPALRGLAAKVRGDHHESAPKHVTLDLRSSEPIAEFLGRNDLDTLSQRGVASPDHVIRSKGKMLILTRQDLVSGAAAISAKVNAYAGAYRERFARQNDRVGGIKIMLEPHPCVAWIEGVGIVGIGKNAASAAATADIAEQTIEVMTLGEASGGFHPIGENDIFDMEYWSLEQAKLAKAKPKPFEGQVVLVTGAASGIGLATAQAFAAQGAALVLADRDGEALEKAKEKVGGACHTVVADLTQVGAGAEIVKAATLRFGGLDILVSNAGFAQQGMLTELSDDELRASFELNFFAHLAVARAAAGVMEKQGTGGQMLFNVSKQAVNPGKGFGAYGMPKAATFFLVKQLALELGGKEIRANGINADRIRSGLLTDDFIASRAKARGVSEESYMAGNLLGKEVEASHVADAFVALAKLDRTTAHVITVDGGNIEASLR